MNQRNNVVAKNIRLLVDFILWVLKCFWSPSKCREVDIDAMPLIVIVLWLLLPVTLMYLFLGWGALLFLGVIFINWITAPHPGLKSSDTTTSTHSLEKPADPFETPDDLRRYDK